MPGLARPNRASRRASLSEARRRASWDWRDALHDRGVPERLRQYPALEGMRAAWVNDHYSVQVFDTTSHWGDVIHLVVRRVDGWVVTSRRHWADLQRIKNELVGEDRIAVEVYPKAEEVMDSANLYHLWVLPVDMVLPFGLHERWDGRMRP